MIHAQAYRILLVEDSPFIRYAARAVLLRRGYEVLEAADGQEALDLLEREVPDAILLDLVMPRRSGVEVLRAVRANPVLEHVPVLVLSNLEAPEAGTAVTGQVQGYFLKAGMSLAQLADRVEWAIQQRGAS